VSALKADAMLVVHDGTDWELATPSRTATGGAHGGAVRFAVG
jgi:hypothetical protein